MTPRSLILGFASIALLAGVAFFNDQVIKNNYIIGNFLPIAVFGPLILLVGLLNPLLARLRRGWALSARELATWMALALFAAYPSGRGFIHYFTTFLMMPHHHARTTPGWQGEPVRLTVAAVRDWPALWAALRSASSRPPGEPVRVAVERLPPGALDGPDTPEQRAALLDALNAVLADRVYFSALRPETLPASLPAHVRHALTKDPARRSDTEMLALHRGLLEAALGDVIVPRRPGVLERVPPRMLAEPARAPAVALDGFITGLGESGRSFPFARIPWSAWGRPMLFWLPLLGTMGLVVVGLALVLHRQWAHYERLPYPTIEFARAMLPAPGGAVPAIFGERSFWIAAAMVFALHAVNYAHVWWPDYIVPVNRQIDLRPLLELAPVFRRGGAATIFVPTLCFTAIGFSFFLASDVGLSLGIAPYVFVLASGIAADFGVAFGGGQHLRPTIESSLYAGAATAVFLTIVYSARRRLAAVFGRALGRRGGDAAAPAEIWGARAAMAGFALFIAQLAAVGVEWPIGLLYTLGAVMIFTVMSRLLAEAGVFFYHPHWYAGALLWGFLGTFAIGPDQLLLIGLVSSLMLIDPREALMPFAVSGIKLADDAGLRWGRVAIAGGAAVILAALVAIPVSLYWQYREGAVKTGDGWTVNSVPRMVYDVNISAVRQLEAQGRLGAAQRLSTWDRFVQASPQRAPTIAFGVTFALALLFTRLRHRFARWPLHPLLFLMGSNYQSRQLAFSFLVGWAAKSLVTQYGGSRAYQRLKPVAIGLVAGEVLAALLPMLVGAIFHAVTGEPPKPFRILPG